jgi:hypothetical protein
LQTYDSGILFIVFIVIFLGTGCRLYALGGNAVIVGCPILMACISYPKAVVPHDVQRLRARMDTILSDQTHLSHTSREIKKMSFALGGLLDALECPPIRRMTSALQTYITTRHSGSGVIISHHIGAGNNVDMRINITHDGASYVVGVFSPIPIDETTHINCFNPTQYDNDPPAVGVGMLDYFPRRAFFDPAEPTLRKEFSFFADTDYKLYMAIGIFVQQLKQFVDSNGEKEFPVYADVWSRTLVEHPEKLYMPAADPQREGSFIPFLPFSRKRGPEMLETEGEPPSKMQKTCSEFGLEPSV